MLNMSNEKYTCPCCGYKTLDEQPPGTYDICSICFWEDDAVQYNDPDYEGGANGVSLRMAQKNYIEFGACDNRSIDSVRKPTPDDVYEGPKDITKISRMPITEMINIFKTVGAPLDKILDIYNGNLQIKNTNFIFNRSQLERYLSNEEQQEYFYISGKNDLIGSVFTGDRKINKWLNMTDFEAEKRMDEIKKKFTDNILNDIEK